MNDLKYVQKYWLIEWQKKGDRFPYKVTCTSKRQADRFEEMFKKDKNIEWVQVSDPMKHTQDLYKQ